MKPRHWLPVLLLCSTAHALRGDKQAEVRLPNRAVEASQVLTGHASVVTHVAWLPKRRIVSADLSGRMLERELDGRVVRAGSVPTVPLPARWRPDGRRVVLLGDDGITQLWDVVSSRQIWRSDGQVWGMGLAVDWSARTPAIAVWDDPGTVRVWKGSRGEPAWTARTRARSVFDLAWSADGQWLAAWSGFGWLYLWDRYGTRRPDIGRPAPGYSRHRRHATLSDALIAWNPKGHQIAVADNGGVKLRVWDIRQRKETELGGYGQPCTALAWSPRGDLIASASSESVFVWDARGRHPRGELWAGNHVGVTSLAWMPDGEGVVGGCSDGSVRVWRL